MEENFDHLEGEWALHPRQHQRVIIHIDIDCFYAQVEMVRNPELRNKPMGVKQKYLMVTSNYIARALGVKKQMYVTEAKKCLPELILIDGSDLTPYRQCSNEISSIAQTFTPHVERMGLDENFLDVTDKVNECCDTYDDDIVGHFYGDKDTNLLPRSDPCGCGCYKRLIVGTQIASALRKKIFESTGITCCAGIAHNKVVAKMVSGYQKPNQQTVIFPWQVCDLMESLDHVKRIPGIGNVTTKALEELDISSVQALQNADGKVLKTRFDEDTCRKLKNLAFGIDEGLVRGSVRPQSLGIEDAFTVTKVTSFEIIRSKYEVLLDRLLKLLATDGRRPTSLKVIVRKSDGIIKFGPRESKQIPLLPSLFSKGVSDLGESCKKSLFSMILNAFHKMVDTSKPFCLTLVGLGFTKLVDQASDSKSIVHFFKKHCSRQVKDTDEESKGEDKDRPNCAVRSDCTSLENSDLPVESEELRHNLIHNDSESNSNFSEVYNDQDNSLLMENMPMHGNVKDIANRNDNHSYNESDFVDGNANMFAVSGGSNKVDHSVPDGIDSDVFNSLPREIQEEILSSYKSNHTSAARTVDSPKVVELGLSYHEKRKETTHSNSLDKFFRPHSKDVKNEFHSSVNMSVATSSNCLTPIDDRCSVTGSIDKVTQDSKLEQDFDVLPKSVDLEVFNSLPEELQKEILDEERKRKLTLSPRKLVEHHSFKKKAITSSPLMKYFKKL